MRLSKTVLMVAVLSIVTIFAAIAHAQLEWYMCSVETAGSAGSAQQGYVNIQLTDVSDSPAFSNVWFRARKGREKEMLAVALTAMSNNMQVRVKMDPAGVSTKDRVIYNMYLCK